MKDRIKKALCTLVCAALIITLSPVHAGALTLTVVNSSLLPLSDSTMPVRLGGEMYVPYAVFSKLGVRAYNEGDVLQLTYGGEYLSFSTSEGYVYDQYQNSYTSPAYLRNNTIYVPVKLCCGKFGLGYSTFSVSGETVLRITDSTAESDLDFTKSNTSAIEQAVNLYNGYTGQTSGNSGGTGNPGNTGNTGNSGGTGNNKNSGNSGKTGNTTGNTGKSGTSNTPSSSQNNGTSQRPGTAGNSSGGNSTSSGSPTQKPNTSGINPTLPQTGSSGTLPPAVEETPLQKPRKVYLAFYGAPNADTYNILDVLKASGRRAAFFLPADALEDWNEDVVRRTAAEGHTLAFFADALKTPEAEALKGIFAAANEKLSLLTGITTRVVSFSGGSGGPSAVSRKKIQDAGYRIWDSTLDAGDETSSAEMAYATTAQQFASTNNDIVLKLHNSGSTAKTVEELCAYMLRQGIIAGLISFGAP